MAISRKKFVGLWASLTLLRSVALRQTGSGKTYTMIGGRGDEERGVLPRAFADLFRTAEERASECEYSLRVRYETR